jgi:hypothetical protein
VAISRPATGSTMPRVWLPLLSTTSKPRADDRERDLPEAAKTSSGVTRTIPKNIEEARVIIMTFSLSSFSGFV